MRRKFALFALPALALVCMLSLPEQSFAQRRGGGGGGRGGWGGGRNGVGISIGSPYYGGYGYGGYGYGYGRGYYSPYYGSTYYGSPYYGGTYGYSTPIYGDNVITAGYQSAYPPAGAVQGGATDPSRVSIHVRVPASAQVLFDDTPTTQTGSDRMFITGPLDVNSTYTYTITARWSENGQERRENRTVRLIPGQTVDVDFMAPAPPQQLQQPRTTLPPIR